MVLPPAGAPGAEDCALVAPALSPPASELEELLPLLAWLAVELFAVLLLADDWLPFWLAAGAEFGDPALVCDALA